MNQPMTRDLNKVIEALEIAENEFRFQASRLETKVTPETENENEHLADLKSGYESSARYAAILRKYHQGRVDRNNEADGADL